LGTPETPAHLTSVERERWDEIIGSLPMNLLTRADTSMLERMAIAWATFRETTARIHASDLVVQGREGAVVRNPLVVIRGQAAQEMQTCAMSLGLSPYARTKLTAPEDGRKPDFLELLVNGAPTLQRGR